MVIQKRKIIILSFKQREYLDGEMAFNELRHKLIKIFSKYKVRDEFSLARNIINNARKYGAVELIVERSGTYIPKYIISHKPRKDITLAKAK